MTKGLQKRPHRPVTGQAIIALGSNARFQRKIPDRIMRAALTLLQDLHAENQNKGSSLLDFQCSALYLSPIWPINYYGINRPVLNAVIQLSWPGKSVELLQNLQKIELKFGRRRRGRGSARSLDLDLIAHGPEQLETPSLICPHPRAHLRAFVLRPLCDLNPLICLPGWKKTAAQYLQSAKDRNHVRKVSASPI